MKSQESMKQIMNQSFEKFAKTMGEEFFSCGNLKEIMEEQMSEFLRRILLCERQIHLESHPESIANGFGPARQLFFSTNPVSLQIPRTRDGFYPHFTPRYQRVVPEDYQELLYSILLSARSFSSVQDSIKHLGLPYSQEHFNRITEELFKEAKDFNDRPLNSDYFFIFADAKAIDLRDEAGRIVRGAHFIVAAINMEAKREILLNRVYFKPESLDLWRDLWIHLKNRGLTRVLAIITDDFQGLSPLILSLFPKSHHLLCSVHMLRNARKHLSKSDYQAFKHAYHEICLLGSFEAALEKWNQLCDQFENQYPGFVKNLRRKSDQFVGFIQYPCDIRSHIKTTNMAEGINNEIESIRKNAGGHFHSEREVLIKMKISIDRLYRSKWKNPSPKFKSVIADLNRMFLMRFEELGLVT